jgi:hypothetical protein
MIYQTRSNSEYVHPTRLGLTLTPNSAIALTSPPWIASVVDRLDHLLALPDNWDGEGGLPLDFETAMAMLAFLLATAFHETPAPQLVPSGTGGIQIEWHMAGSDLEISFEPGQPATFFYIAPDGKEKEGEVISEEGLVGELIRNLPFRD